MLFLISELPIEGFLVVFVWVSRTPTVN